MDKALRIALALGVGFWAGQAAAQEIGSCTFTQECMEGEACADTAFSLTIALRGTATDAGEPLFIVTDAETIDVFRPNTFDGRVYVGTKGGQSVMLSVADDGRARYAVHLNSDDVALTYVGQCEVL